MSGKNSKDYITHLPVDFGSLPSNFIVNRGKELIIGKYSSKNKTNAKGR